MISDDMYDEICEYNTKNRILILNQIIDDLVINDFVTQIYKWNREDRKLNVEDREPIRIIINSCGGLVSSGLALIDTIQASKTPIKILGIGEVCSSGYLIYLACKLEDRYAMRHTVFLQHEGTNGTYGNVSKTKDTMEFFDKQEKYIGDYVSAQTYIDRDTYEANFQREWYMTPDEALENGVCSKIITSLDEF